MTYSRKKVDLCDDWQFTRRKPRRAERKRGLATADRQVSLPHCYNSEDVFKDGVRYYQGPATYSRSFSLPDTAASERGRWALRSRGFYGTGEAWLGGRSLGRFDGQYLGIDLPLPRELSTQRDHSLVITVTNRCAKHVLPGHKKQPDFVLFGGLAGKVWLEWLPDGHLLQGTLDIRTHDVTRSPRLEVRLKRDLCQTASTQANNERLTCRMSDLSGAILHEASFPAPTPGDATLVEMAAPNAELWHPDQPRLYQLTIELSSDSQVVDTISRRFGFREMKFDRNGFSLNGERLFLAGFNRHEWAPGQGNALSPAQHRRDAEILVDYGANFVRLSHYPQSPDFLDACDELGLLVYAEIATWKSVRGGRWLKSALRQMQGMIERDRHHPSIILWGMGNESQHRGAYKKLSELAHELDPDRATTYAENHLYRAKRSRTLGIPDVWSINYELEQADVLREHSTSGAVLVSEVCNDLALRGDEEAEQAQVDSLHAFWAELEKHPHVAGYLLWSFNDYPTLFRDRFTRTTGKFDAWRRPKAAAQAFRHKRKGT